MFERFTDRARRAVVVAGDLCRMNGGNAIDSRYLLAALADDTVGGVAYQVLEDMDFDPAKIELDDNVVKPVGHLPFTPECKKTLEYALREALQIGHNYVGTEHMLLAICRPSNATCLAQAELHKQNHPELVYAAVQNKLKGYADDDSKVELTDMKLCVKRGGHCFVEKQRTRFSNMASSVTQVHEACKHCSAKRVGTPREAMDWEYPDGQP